jgi:hypothetical protein
MAAKSIINELYQRLRTAAPIYSTRADDADGFLCTLTLPAVECEFEALSAADRSFTGKGCSKKVSESMFWCWHGFRTPAALLGRQSTQCRWWCVVRRRQSMQQPSQRWSC